MHIVEPSGSTKPAICGGIFSSSSATAMLVGSVALLELVENAVTMLARTRLQKTRGERPPSRRTSTRSEERRVGKECRSRGSAYHRQQTPRTNRAIPRERAHNRLDETQ